MMNLRQFHNWLKRNRKIRIIDKVFMVDSDEGTLEECVNFKKLILKVNYQFWVISVDNKYDEIDIKIRKKFPVKYKKWQENRILQNLVGMRIEQIFIIFNFNLYTDAMKFKIVEQTNSNQSNFVGVLSFYALGNMYYEFRHDGIEKYL